MVFLILQDFPTISSAFGKKVHKLSDRGWDAASDISP